MAVKDLTTTQVNALSNTRDTRMGFLYAAQGLQPFYNWLIQSLDHISRGGAPWFNVVADDANDTTVRVLPGRAVIAEAVLSYSGAAIDLVAYDDDVAYVWAYDVSGTLTIGKGPDAAGWPLVPHIKLAEVTLVSSVITAILDRRPETPMRADVAYTMTIETQGSTAGASRIHIEGANETDYIRVRVCDDDGYVSATNATIAAAGSSAVVGTNTATKDLVFKSDANGLFEIDLTDATAETVTLRIGPPPLGARRASYEPTLDVTHA